MLVNNLDEAHQSAFKYVHSTETALIRVKNDITMSIDQGQAVALVLLDLSTAFDTIDHDVLFCRLEKLFCLSENVLDWFTSYLKERSQPASIQDVLSLGVPQGSVLGPALFTVCTKPLSTIAQRYRVKYHLYADDTQLYVSLDPGNKADVSSSFENL